MFTFHFRALSIDKINTDCYLNSINEWNTFSTKLRILIFCTSLSNTVSRSSWEQNLSHVTQLNDPPFVIHPKVSNCFESFRINLERKTCVHSIVLFVFFHVVIVLKFIKQSFVKKTLRRNRRGKVKCILHRERCKVMITWNMSWKLYFFNLFCFKFLTIN